MSDGSPWELEEAGWRALSNGTARQFYEDMLDADALMVFPGGLVLGRGEILSSMGGQPWKWYRIEDKREVVLTDRTVLLAYRASAQREGQPPYDAVMSSVYIRREGRWKLTFHQQTPL